MLSFRLVFPIGIVAIIMVVVGATTATSSTATSTARVVTTVVLEVCEFFWGFNGFCTLLYFILSGNFGVQTKEPQLSLDRCANPIPKFDSFFTFIHDSNHVEQFFKFKSIFWNIFIVLEAFSKFLPKFRSVVWGETIIEQLNEEFFKGPLMRIEGHTLGVKIVSLAFQVVWKDESIPIFANFSWSDIVSSFCNETMVGTCISSTIIFYRRNRL